MIETATTSLTTLGDVLERAMELEWDGVLFLPDDPTAWSAETVAFVAPEYEIDDQDRHPEANKYGMKYTLNISAVQDVKANALTQSSEINVNLLVDALRYYFTRDAFMVLSSGPHHDVG